MANSMDPESGDGVIASRAARRVVTRICRDDTSPPNDRDSRRLRRSVSSPAELSVNELAKHLDLDRTTTGKNLCPLEPPDFVGVAPSATDGRSRKTTLTAEGLAALKAAAPL